MSGCHIITHMDLDVCTPWIWILKFTHMDLDMTPCLHTIIAHMDGYGSMSMHIIAHMDMDMTPCLSICHFKFIIPF